MPGIKLPKNVFKGDVAVDQFYCVSCKLLLRDPVQAACGHRLCKSCADEIIKNETTPQCPECGEGFDEEDGVKVRNRKEFKIIFSSITQVLYGNESMCTCAKPCS
jgi:hypothetical protein